MSARSTRPILASLVTIALVSQTIASQAADRKVDPQVLRALKTGIVGPRSLQMGPLKPGAAPVVIELTKSATPAILAELEARGAVLRPVQGRPLSYDRFVPAVVSEASLAAVLASPSVNRVRNAPASGLVRPLNHSAELMDLAGARGSRPALDSLTGEGIVVADLDSNADVFHPQFFRADAGWFDWIDVDDDGLFSPGTDAIDLDSDGAVGATEVGVWLKARTLMPFWGDEVSGRSPEFDPAVDWIYLDENENSERDFGAVDGFDDSVPAFGEPLFVPDDVNQNGQLDVGERVARLGTSKFSKVYVRIEYYADVNHVYERGVDLSSHQNDFTGGVYGYSDAMHGSGVLSVVAADVPLVGRRWVGMAPDADLLLGFEVGASASNSVAWALNEKPDVMLHETAYWTGEPLDGSDSYSAMVDASVVNDGVTHTCPTGNLGGSRKHAPLSIAGGATTIASFDLPSTGITYAQVTLNFRGGSELDVVLREPNGTEHSITGNPDGTLSTGALLYVGTTTSSRGTVLWDTLLYSSPSQSATKPVPVGEWEVEVHNAGNSAVSLDAYLMDEVSGWAVGAAWDPSIATDASTAGIPSVSDHCIAVGAHTGHPGSASEPWFYDTEGPGEVRGYSSRGPRIDGEQKPDLLAPDNPWSAAPNDLDYDGDLTPHGSVWPMGGTSGATPHVTGVTALMAQAGIRGLAAREALRNGAISDALTGTVPNADYGWGRINAALAFGASTGGQAPSVSLTASPSPAALGQTVTLDVSAIDPDGEPSALEAKWDDGYDGSWDVPYGSIEARQVSFNEVGRIPVKVRVRDADGRFGEAVVWIEVTDDPIEPDAGVDAGVDAGDSGVGGEGGSGGTASDGGAGSAASPSADRSNPSDGGCGCRAPRGNAGGAAGWVLLGLGVLAARRRRGV